MNRTAPFVGQGLTYSGRQWPWVPLSRHARAGRLALKSFSLRGSSIAMFRWFLVIVSISIAAPARAEVWKPSSGVQVPLWPTSPPDAAVSGGPEGSAGRAESFVAERDRGVVHDAIVRDVSRPTMTVY